MAMLRHLAMVKFVAGRVGLAKRGVAKEEVKRGSLGVSGASECRKQSGANKKYNKIACVLVLSCSDQDRGLCFACAVVKWKDCYDGNSRERNSGENFRRHRQKMRRNIGENLCRFSPFDFQEKWPQEISRKIVHIFHEGQNKILPLRDSGSGGPQKIAGGHLIYACGHEQESETRNLEEVQAPAKTSKKSPQQLCKNRFAIHVLAQNLHFQRLLFDLQGPLCLPKTKDMRPPLPLLTASQHHQRAPDLLP